MDSRQIDKIGNVALDLFHYLALFLIGATVVWSAGYEYIGMIKRGYADLKDILLLFIYLELGVMTGIYFKTRRLPVQFLIFIAITALSRHLVIDVQHVSEPFHLYLLLGISGSVVILSGALYMLSRASYHYGRPDEDINAEVKERVTER